MSEPDWVTRGGTIYVPAAGSYAEKTIARGSGIVGHPDELGRVTIYYEGAIYGPVNMETLEDRLYFAWSRCVDRASTSALMAVDAGELVRVGYVVATGPPSQGRPQFVIEEHGLVDAWCMTPGEKLRLVREQLGVGYPGDRGPKLAAKTRYLVGDAVGANIVGGNGSVWIEERQYANLRDLRDSLASQAGDSDNPNPLPGFVIDLNQDPPTLGTLVYNDVSGMEFGEVVDVTDFGGDPSKVITFLEETS